MNRIIRASLWSGTILVPLFFIVVFVRNTDAVEISLDLFYGLAIATAFLWLTGTLIAFVLLLPLKPLADHVRAWISLPLFLVVGFFISAWVEYEMMQTGAHGNPPPIDTEPWTKLVFETALIGLMGSGCALASWLSLRKSASDGAETGKPNKPVQTTALSRRV